MIKKIYLICGIYLNLSDQTTDYQFIISKQKKYFYKKNIANMWYIPKSIQSNDRLPKSIQSNDRLPIHNFSTAQLSKAGVELSFTGKDC